MVIDVQLHIGRTLDTVTQIETIGPYARVISEDYALYTAGAAMLEAADRLVADEKEPAVQQYWLLAGGLRALAERAHAPCLVLDSYLLRAFAVAGWAPSFDDCARCGEPGPHHSFSAPTGGAVCLRCRPPGSASPSPETFALLAALLTGDWPMADASDERHRREASGLVAAYTQFHLERTLRALKHVDRAPV